MDITQYGGQHFLILIYCNPCSMSLQVSSANKSQYFTNEGVRGDPYQQQYCLLQQTIQVFPGRMGDLAQIAMCACAKWQRYGGEV